jgi:nucleotide-binding universal stress UspA family protein
MLNRILGPLECRASLATLLPPLRLVVGGTGALVHLLMVRPLVRCAEYCGGRLLYLDELMLQERTFCLDYLARSGSQLAYDGVVVDREVRFGDPLAETLAAVERHAMHLIALTARRQPWPERLLRPNPARRLLSHASSPVLTVPAERPRWQGVVLRYDRVPV